MNLIKATNKDDCVMGYFSTKYDAKIKNLKFKNEMTIIQILTFLLSVLFRKSFLLSIVSIVFDCEFVVTNFSSSRTKMVIFKIMTRIYAFYLIHLFLKELKLKKILDEEKKIQYCKTIKKNRKCAQILKEMNRKFVIFKTDSYYNSKKANVEKCNWNKMTM
ncbi:hypothetical protein EDEG_01964 [Edhazardia aedis USNM 41457]|uniref:Uncharacterized protein n=1 Tax=Edhazardia aedis (strain USNM 41457) TaxID=1003232 RepID=J9D8C5_EDHAE|nr:hypothetical protein EDEG_01964 [Edhazardia aedis USNM 41457]|eukprot:EJW03769.1 hypothetical protein EDEG_01964 [Edhazardia aedis USNM 41457]